MAAGPVSRRLWALVALALLAAAVGLAVAVAVLRFPRGLSVLACLVFAAIAGWYGVRRRGAPRMAGLAAAAVLAAGAIALVVIEGQVVPFIKGTAFVTAEAELVIDERDPFCWGIPA